MVKVESKRKLKKVTKTVLLSLLVFSLLSACGLFTKKPKVEYPLLTIFHTNDVHGSVDGIGGLAQVATYIKTYKKEHPQETVLVVNAGDFNKKQIIDEISCGAVTFEVVDKLGYDYITFGNHEFNYGYHHLKENIQRLATTKVICGNVFAKRTEESIVPAYDIFMIGDVKIGIFGMVTADKSYYKLPDLSALYFTNPTAEAEKILAHFQDEKVDISIALVHLAVRKENTDKRHLYPDFFQLENLDLIIDGHDHLVCPSDETGCYYDKPLIVRNKGHLDGGIGIVKVWYKDGQASFTSYKVSKAEINGGKEQPLNRQLQDPEIMATYRAALRKYNSIVTVSLQDFNKKAGDFNENKFVRLMADSYRYYGGCDIALVMNREMKANIKAGFVSTLVLYKAVANGKNWNQADNIVRVKMKGYDIIKLFKLSCSYLNNGSRDFLQASGVEVVYTKKTKKKKAKVYITLNGEPLQPSADYDVALSLELFKNSSYRYILRNYRYESLIGLDYLLVADYLSEKKIYLPDNYLTVK